MQPQSPYTLNRLYNPTYAQLETSAEVFAGLEKNDIALLGLCGGDVKLLKPLGLAMLRAGALDGEFYAATNDADDILGYVLTMPKGKVLFSTEEQRNLGFTDFMARLSEEGKEYYQNVYLKTFPQFVSSCIQPMTMIDVCWIHMAFTRTENQRQGIATGLIRMVLDKAVAEGVTVALSATNATNVPVYEEIGFKVIGRKDASSPWGDWSLWVFRYEPTQA